MAGFTLNYTFANNAFAEMQSSGIKYWDAYGIPDFEGDLEGFSKAYPDQMAELIAEKIIFIGE